MPLTSQLLFLSVAFILGCGLPSWWKQSHQQLQLPTCNLEVLCSVLPAEIPSLVLISLSESITMARRRGSVAAWPVLSYTYSQGDQWWPSTTETTSTERGAVSQKDCYKKRDELMLNESKPRVPQEPELLILKALKEKHKQRES